MNYNIIFLLLCLPFLAACGEDDDGPEAFCLEPTELTGCELLAELSPEVHFNALVGEWRVVHTESSPESNDVRTTCVRPELSLGFIEFFADSTYTSFDTDVAIEGRWEIGEDTDRNGNPISTLVTDNGAFWTPVSHLCDDGFAYLDQRPLDGAYFLLKRTDE